MTQPAAAPPAPIRVLLVEDHDMVAEAIGLALQRAGDIEVVARVRSLADALAGVRPLGPHVVVLDRRLPDGDGIAAIAEFGAASPAARVLVITGEADSATALRVVRAGGAGLVLKSASLVELEAAVRRIAAGDVAFGPGLLGEMLDRLTGRSAAAGLLTPREMQTLELMADGRATRTIARRLGVADNTARNHVQRVLVKLGASSKLEAVAIARRAGLID
ncbi:MAG TPA: response regulator transcription factor [Actinocrinis sp.]|jgi:DNA-binding NarL/FixJ family response regulator